MNPWIAKLRRDLAARAGQFLAVALTTLLGVALFGASYDAYQNLVISYDTLFERTHFADLSVTGGDLNAYTEAAKATPGVADVMTRTVVESYGRVGDHRLLVRVVGLPAGQQPAIDQVLVQQGSYLDPGRPNGVLVEQHMARYYGLAPGDTLDVRTPFGWESVPVLGVVASPEYLWPARSRQEPLTLPENFGVVFAAQGPLALLSGGQGREALATVAPGADRAAVLARLERAARDAGATGVTTRAEQASNALLHEDIAGFGEMAVLFPILFLGAAALTAFVVISRLVHAQRTLIGTLLANGVRRRAVLAHHIAFGVVPAGAGALLGALAGEGLALLISRLYTRALSIPITVIHPHPLVALSGVAMALVVVVAAALAPALDASRVPPAAAMRGATPSGRGGRSLIERWIAPLGRLPASAKLVMRGAVRNPGRSVTTMLGVVLALVLVMVSLGMLDTTKVLLSQQFDRIQKQDAELYVQGHADASLEREIAGVPGVDTTEPALVAPVVVEHGGRSYRTGLTALRTDTRMHTFLAPDGRSTTLPSDGVLLGAGMRSQLGVTAGDTVTLDLPHQDATWRTTVAGFVDEPLGSFAYASLPAVQRALQGAGGATGDGAGPDVANVFLVRLAPGADRASSLTRLGDVAGVLAVVDARSLQAAADRLMRLFYVIVGLMLLFGATLAFALIFSTMTVNIAERTGELATLRAAGARQGQIARIVSGENLVLVALGLLPGLALGYLTAYVFMASFSSDMFRFDLHVTWVTWTASVVSVVLAAVVSEIPALRSVARMDLAQAVRSRGT